VASGLHLVWVEFVASGFRGRMNLALIGWLVEAQPHGSLALEGDAG
jgi:hypothetical protein